MPRVTKTKAPVVATPRRATRSTVRAGSASLEEPIEVAAPRRRGSRSKTPESKNSSFEKAQPEHHLPALAEEVEQSPRILLPQPIEVAPIADASPYVTPQHYHIAATRNTLSTVSQSPRSSPIVGRGLNKSPAVAQSIHNSPTVSQLVSQSPIVSKSLHTSPSISKSVRSSPALSRSVQQSFELYVDEDQTEDLTEGDYDLPSTIYDLPSDSYIRSDIGVAEDDQEEEEAAQEAAASQLAHETAEAGLSQSLRTSPVLLKTPTTTASSLAGHSTSKRRRSARSGGFLRTPTFGVVNPLDLHSPLGDISGNSPGYWKEFFRDSLFKSSSPASPITSPVVSQLMERAIKNDEIIPELTDRQSTAVLMDMRREILRLRKIEEQYLAEQFLASQQPQQPQPAVKSPQPPAVQEPSPEIPRTINRVGDLRYHRSVASPARKRLLAQREAEKAAAAAAAAAEAEQAAEEEQQIDQTPSRSQSSASRSSLSSANSKRKSSQNGTPDAQTPQPSSQNSAPAETPAASPAWGLTSLFGSVKNIFTHRPNFSPSKQIQQQPQEQSHEQSMPQPQQAAQQNLFTPSPVKEPRRFFSSSQQSPTPKPRAVAPPATPAPTIHEEAEEDDGLYGQVPRTTRRRGHLPGSMPRRKLNTPAKPKEANADLRASQLALGAQRTAEREQAQEKADRLERERLAIVEELKKRDSAYNIGDKRKMQVNVDDLAVIPRKAAGASSGTYGLMDDFFNYDDDSDIVEMDEDDVQLLPAPEHPTKRVRLDDNVFVPKTPAPAPQPTTTSPVKQAAAPQQQQPTIPVTPAPNYSQLTQQAIEKQRLRFSEHKPKQPSRLRNVERLSTGSTVGAPSPQQPITAPLQDIQEVAAPVEETQEVVPVAQLANTSAPKAIDWPELGPPMASPEAFARADLIYTPELKALDHEFYMRGFANAMANSLK